VLSGLVDKAEGKSKMTNEHPLDAEFKIDSPFYQYKILAGGGRTLMPIESSDPDERERRLKDFQAIAERAVEIADNLGLKYAKPHDRQTSSGAWLIDRIDFDPV
jgi:hypothetical protein